MRKRGRFIALLRYYRSLLTLHQGSYIPASTQVLHLGRSLRFQELMQFLAKAEISSVRTPKNWYLTRKRSWRQDHGAH